MSTEDILEQLKHFSIDDRLALIEAMTRQIGEELRSREPAPLPDDPILQVAGCLEGDPLSAEAIDDELYGKR